MIISKALSLAALASLVDLARCGQHQESDCEEVTIIRRTPVAVVCDSSTSSSAIYNTYHECAPTTCVVTVDKFPPRPTAETEPLCPDGIKTVCSNVIETDLPEDIEATPTTKPTGGQCERKKVTVMVTVTEPVDGMTTITTTTTAGSVHTTETRAPVDGPDVTVMVVEPVGGFTTLTTTGPVPGRTTLPATAGEPVTVVVTEPEDGITTVTTTGPTAGTTTLPAEDGEPLTVVVTEPEGGITTITTTQMAATTTLPVQDDGVMTVVVMEPPGGVTTITTTGPVPGTTTLPHAPGERATVVVTEPEEGITTITTMGPTPGITTLTENDGRVTVVVTEPTGGITTTTTTGASPGTTTMPSDREPDTTTVTVVVTVPTAITTITTTTGPDVGTTTLPVDPGDEITVIVTEPTQGVTTITTTVPAPGTTTLPETDMGPATTTSGEATSDFTLILETPTIPAYPGTETTTPVPTPDTTFPTVDPTDTPTPSPTESPTCDDLSNGDFTNGDGTLLPWFLSDQVTADSSGIIAVDPDKDGGYSRAFALIPSQTHFAQVYLNQYLPSCGQPPPEVTMRVRFRFQFTGDSTGCRITADVNRDSNDILTIEQSNDGVWQNYEGDLIDVQLTYDPLFRIKMSCESNTPNKPAILVTDISVYDL